jgi:lipopolysaccharide transport system ATP-binding protein
MSTAIKFENLYKEYRLGIIGHGTLYRDLQSWWAKLRKQEDPNSLIGSSQRNSLKDQILALDNINLEIKKGEVLGIIGSNGAGKSTLLKILSRVTGPTSGSIKIKGRIASLLEVGTGFHPELTGRENIFLNGAINGMDKYEVSRKFDEIVDFSGVEKFVDTPVKRYSSGMYVRLGFAVAAFLEPDILVVDEVLAVGDASFQKKAIGKMKDVSTGQGRTVLFVSHNMSSISNLCNRAILIDKGKIIEDGDTNYVIDRYFNYKVQTQAVVGKKSLEDIKEEKIYAGDKLFEVHNISITDKNGSQRLDFNSNEEINVKIKFKCLEEVKKFRLAIYINVGMGPLILSTHFCDEEKMLSNVNLKPGDYYWGCKIPPNTLGNNPYYLSIQFLEHSTHHLLFNNIFRINVNYIGYNNILNVIDASSPIRPKLKWEKL